MFSSEEVCPDCRKGGGVYSLKKRREDGRDSGVSEKRTRAGADTRENGPSAPPV